MAEGEGEGMEKGAKRHGGHQRNSRREKTRCLEGKKLPNNSDNINDNGSVIITARISLKILIVDNCLPFFLESGTRNLD